MNCHFKNRESRRVFLRTGAAIGLTLGCAADSGSEPEAFGAVSAGNVSGLPVGSLRALSDAPVIVGRDADGIYAMTSTCTHEGCDMAADGSVGADGVYCGCHGSRFDANGAGVRGPATVPLRHFAVTIDATGNIGVDGNAKVAATTRTPVA